MTELVNPSGVDEDAVVENLMQILQKGFSAIQLYSPNNKIYLRAVDRLRAAFALVWQHFEELTLEVSESTLTWEDTVVVTQEDKSDSIPWTLYKDGVRSVTFAPAVEEREILAFLHIIKDARSLPPDASDDLLTLLWRQDFQHLSYTFVELGYDDVPRLESESVASAAVDEVTSAEETKQRLGAEVGSPGEPQPGLVNIDDFDSTLYFLDDHEINCLKGEIDREYRQNLRAKVLGLVFEVFQLQTSMNVRGEILSIVEEFVPYLLAMGDFQSVALILRKLREMQERAPDLADEHRKIIAAIPGRISHPTAFGQLIQSLDDAGVQPTTEEITELFSGLGPQVLNPVLDWLPRLANQRVREVLREVAKAIAHDHPAQVVTALKTRDVTALQQTIQLVSALKVEALVLEFGKLVRHSDAAVRRAAVDALGEIGSPTALKQLEPAVEDGERDIRVAAVQFCVTHGYSGILPQVEATVKGKKLRGSDLAEKKPFFEAYGMFGGNAAIASLYEMLYGRGVFRRKDDSATRACAAMALGKIGTPEARAALEKASAVKDPLVRAAVNSALREMPT
ncbi:MAG: hypothetical protein GTN78_00400 [Gemmatimonadales bacterium]|nr:hypothetical protein [Gemmatimonadales bacterium]NIQ98652.1 hypothetical protein [Gemmatimonadales bacterium]